MTIDFSYLTSVAIDAAQAAGKIIQQHLHSNLEVMEKAGGESRAAQVLTQVDLACEQVILSHLQESCARYDLALLSEETPDDGSRFEKPFFWCIDPMDGTLAFINRTPGFSVSIALVARDGTPHIGVVYDPSTHTLYHAQKGLGAFINGQPWVAKPARSFFTYVTDRSGADLPSVPELQPSLKQVLPASMYEQVHESGKEMEVLAGAGAVLSAMRVAENGPACFFKPPKPQPGGGSLWDYAATACIFAALGLSATSYAGDRLDLNRKDSSFMNREGVLYLNLSEGRSG